MNRKETYNKLISHYRNVSLLSSCSALLNWDQQTYMPPSGANHRAEQLALLAGIIHERSTNSIVKECLNLLDENISFTQEESANIREIKYEHIRNIKVSSTIIEDIASATAIAHSAWEKAKKQSDFKILLPHLERVVQVKKEYSEAIGYSKERYDALLEGYEPELSSISLGNLFFNLSRSLKQIIDNIRNKPLQGYANIYKSSFPIEKQIIFAKLVASKIGFESEGGRIDTVSHPFSVSIGPGDLRITSRWQEQNIEAGLFTVLHETGHALYEQRLPRQLWGTPVGTAKWLSLHESQSRMWEIFIGKSKCFWNYFFPLLKAFFPEALSNVSLEEYYNNINRICPSLIRIGADEIHYNLHIILRYDLERALINGDLNVIDLPCAWKEKVHELFDLDVPSDDVGCLQDAHWPDGDFGYFPTYTLGNLYAAQFYTIMKKDLPTCISEMSNGNFDSILNWVTNNIYSKGSLYRPVDLCKIITGESIHEKYFIDYLRNKYLENRSY